MASTSNAPNPAPAPWKSTFESHMRQLDSPEFVFSSLHPAPAGSATPHLPRARYCIFRGFWAELPANKHNEAPRNAAVYESDLPTFTTDARMNKPLELFASSGGGREESRGESGGGGPCEAVWWVKSAMVQWRVRGEAFVVAPDIEAEGEGSGGARNVKAEIGKRMRVVDERGREGWSWQKELTAHFGNLSPGMRGTFAAPPPGQPVDQPYDDENLKLGRSLEDLDDPVARRNFRVVIIRPEEVETVDLSDPKTARRQVYRYDSATGEWSQEECWP